MKTHPVIVSRKVEDLIPYARNSRTHSDAQVAQIAASVREFGWTNPVLVDGEFVQAKHDISLRFRGSSNQRLLDVKKTLAAGQPVWWEDEKVFATHTMEK